MVEIRRRPSPDRLRRQPLPILPSSTCIDVQRMIQLPVQLLLSLLLLLGWTSSSSLESGSEGSSGGGGGGSGPTCGTLPSTIHVTKEEYDDTGRVVRSCEGVVAVNKCEGTCISQLQPSVVTPTGFLKDCQCCRESWMRSREVKLIECYDFDGQKLKEKEGIMIIQMQEPEECICHTCGT